jgi:hypothetical protein
MFAPTHAITRSTVRSVIRTALLVSVLGGVHLAAATVASAQSVTGVQVLLAKSTSTSRVAVAVFILAPSAPAHSPVIDGEGALLNRFRGSHQQRPHQPETDQRVIVGSRGLDGTRALLNRRSSR